MNLIGRTEVNGRVWHPGVRWEHPITADHLSEAFEAGRARERYERSMGRRWNALRRWMARHFGRVA